jgi:ParB/RepB/Spo0J family partition protein
MKDNSQMSLASPVESPPAETAGKTSNVQHPTSNSERGEGRNGAAPLVQMVGLAEIVRSPFNREIDTKAPAFLELVANVREHGIIQPLIGRALPEAFNQESRKAGNPRIELVAGERRWLAASQAGATTVPVIVRKLNDTEALELQAIENEKRQDLSPIEKAEKYRQLLEQYEKAGLTKEKAIGELCRKLSVGKNGELGKSTVYEALRLTKLPAAVKAAVQSGTLPASHAGLIAKLPEELQPKIAKAIAPGRPIANYREEEQLQKETGIDVQYERDPDSGLVSFREAKEIVDDELEQLEQAAKYEAVAVQFRAKGGTALEWAAARKTANNLISSSDWLSDFGQYVRDLTKGIAAMPKQIMRPQLHEPAKPEMVYRKDELVAALKKSGVKPRGNTRGGTTNTDYRALEKARLERERQKKAILAKLIEPIRTAAAKRNAKIPWPTFLSALLAWSAHSICERRGWKCNYKDADKVVADQVAKMPENQMAGLVADIVIEKLTTAHTGSYQPGLVELGKFYGVDVKAIEKAALGKTGNRKPETGKAKTKVRASGRAKTAAETSKVQRGGLTAAKRKQLSAAMKARWAARRKATKK